MKTQIIIISLLLYLNIFANGKSINHAAADTVQLEYRDITHIVSVDLFESIKTFILNNGDTYTYSTIYSDNPHFSFEGFELFLNPDIGFYNSNCDTSKSDFNEIAIRDNHSNHQYYFIRIIRKGDIANEQIITYEGMSEDKVYLINFDTYNMDSMVNNVSKYIEIIKKDVTTNIKAPKYGNIDNIAIYPNPANETFTIKSANHQAASCHLYNSTGKLVKTLVVENGINTYNISKLKSGVYFIPFQVKGKIFVRKLVKY